MKLITSVKISCGALVLLCLGCQPYQPQMDTSGIVYCSEGSPTTFNPQLNTSGTTIDATAYQLYDRLLNFNAARNKVSAGLASSYKVSKDGLIYTFQLRRNVKFHQTDYFTPTRFFNADDVLFSIDRWRLSSHPYHNVSGGEYPYFESLQLAKNINSVKRINGYRVEIELRQPDSSFLANLASDFSIILSQEYANLLTDQGNQQAIDQYPIGTGPYKYHYYQLDEYIRFSPHQDYWKLPPKQPLIFDITQVSAMRIGKLLTGECDVISFPAQEELQVLQQASDIQVETKPGLNVGFWAFNTQKPPFDNRLVRTALTMAIDKDTLLDTIYFDNAVKAKGLVPPSSWAYDPSQSMPSYNPKRAKELLEQAGYAQGFVMDIWAMPIQRAYNPNAIKMAELIRSYLAKIDVTVNIVTYPWATFRAKLNAQQHDSVLIGWTADNLDPDNFFRPLLTCHSNTNRSNWCNSQYDAIVNQAIVETDQQQRTELYKIASSLINLELPLVAIAHANRYQPHRKNIHGMSINPIGGISFADAERRQ